MKVLILINYSGGLYRQRYELIQKMLDSDYEVFFSTPDEEKVIELKKMGCKFESCSYNRHGVNIFKEFALLLSYVRIIHRILPDVVLTYTIKPNIYGGIACSLLKIPYISNITGLGTALENEGILLKIVISMYRLGLRKAKMVFFQNKRNRDFMLNHHTINSEFALIPGSGVNLTQHVFEPFPIDDGNITFLFIGRLMKDKGIEEYVYAATKIHERYDNIYFIAIGGCEKEYLASLTNLEKTHCVEVLGQQTDVHDFIKKSHAVVLPSYHEGMSNALLEAAASGRPILASDIPGCREAFDEGISGFGFKPRDADSLCETIEKFIALPYEAKAEMGKAGRRKMEKEFDRNIVVEKYMNELKSIAKEQ